MAGPAERGASGPAMGQATNRWIRVGLCALVAAVYLQVRGHEFLNWDDGHFVVANPHVNRGLTAQGAAWAFTTDYTGNWHPLAWLSHMLDVSLFGMRPGGHHLTAAAIHLAATLVLFDALRTATGDAAKSAFVAALFGVHPQHVESVAWVTERKDVLSALFWMLTTAAYVRWTRAPSPRRYALVLAAYALALMSKPMVVTLPFALMLLDVWPLRRTAERPWTRLVAEKIPLLVLAAAAGAATFLASRAAGSLEEGQSIPFALRAQNAAVACVEYVAKTVWPVGLAAYYPHPDAIPVWKWAGAAALLALATAFAVRERARRPWLFVGWLWFLGTLLPVIGLVKVGRQAMADRFTYLPHVGLFVVLAWGGAELLRRLSNSKSTAPAAGVCAVLVCAALAWAQVGTWKDTPTLWTHAIAVTGDNRLAENNFGAWLSDGGDVEASIPHFQAAIRIEPTDPAAHDNLGQSYRRLGRLDEAEKEIREALRLKPVFPQAQRNLGVTLAQRGRLDEAVVALKEAVRLDPTYALAFNDLAVLHDRMSRLDDAVAAAAEAVRLAPDDDAYRQDLETLRAKKDAKRP
jgi:tetratricopeptide (TPR) repeat protein